MKGRRRARRLALQALYELDQSTHAVDDVLRYRGVEVYLAALEPLLGASKEPLAHALAENFVADGLDSDAARGLAVRYGSRAVDPAPWLDALTELRPQVQYGVTIVHGVMAHRGRLDEVIAQIAPEWPVNQMAPVDRNILRMALWEIGSASSPIRVAINEAVELARIFSGEGARRMVNGALGTFASGRFALKLALDHE